MSGICILIGILGACWGLMIALSGEGVKNLMWVIPMILIGVMGSLTL